MILGLTFVAMLAGAIGVLVSTPERQGRIILAQIGAGVAIIVLGGKLLPDASKGEEETRLHSNPRSPSSSLSSALW